MRRLLSAALIAVSLAACTPGEDTPAVSYDFEQTGNLTRNNPGLTPGVWYLQYEEPGQPGLTMRLSFDDDSRCITDAGRGECERSLFESGLRVSIRGNQDGNGVLVGEMEVEQ